MQPLLAFSAGALITVGFLIAGHYAFRPPRLTLNAPWSYVYGVSAVLLGAAMLALLLGAWTVHLAYVAGLFGIGGLCVIALYRIDQGIETRHTLADLQERSTAAERQRQTLNAKWEDES
jgi:hypothetical protein